MSCIFSEKEDVKSSLKAVVSGCAAWKAFGILPTEKSIRKSQREVKKIISEQLRVYTNNRVKNF